MAAQEILVSSPSSTSISSAAVPVVPVHLLALKVFNLFAATAEMRLEVAKQGGLEYLLSLVAWGERLVAPEANAVMEALYGVDDAVLAFLPLRCVVLLARCALAPVKMQAAKTMCSIAKNYAAAAQTGGQAGPGGGHNSETVVPLVRVVVALVEESMDALQVGAGAGGGSHVMFTPPQANEVVMNAMTALRVLAEVQDYRKGIQAQGLGLLLEVMDSSAVASPAKVAAAAILVQVAEARLGDPARSAAVLLAAVRSPLAGGDQAFSLATSQLLARLAGGSAGRHALDACNAPNVILDLLVDAKSALASPLGTRVRRLTIHTPQPMTKTYTHPSEPEPTPHT